jgi:hypothetical protein
MRRLLPALLLVAVAAGCGGTRTVVRTVTVAPKPTGDQRLFGRIDSLERRGDHYELRFDPAWFLSGVAANVAQAQDQGTTCAPSACPPVANDNYVIDESHRLLTFILPATTRGTVLTKGGPLPAGTTIGATQLAELVAGTSRLKLFEPLSSGVWIVVHVDTVRSFAQQYRP